MNLLVIGVIWVIVLMILFFIGIGIDSLLERLYTKHQERKHKKK